MEKYVVDGAKESTQAFVTTLVGSSAQILRGKHFEMLLIDEAGQALEPACWIPITKADKVVFAGDHCQLPPTVKSKEAAKGGLDAWLNSPPQVRGRSGPAWLERGRTKAMRTDLRRRKAPCHRSGTAATEVAAAQRLLRTRFGRSAAPRTSERIARWLDQPRRRRAARLPCLGQRKLRWSSAPGRAP